MEYKKYTKKELSDFAEDNFMEEEDIERIYDFIKHFCKVNLDMEYGEKDKTGNKKGVLVIRISENG